MLAESRRVLIAVNKTHEGEIKSLFEREPLSQWLTLYADSFPMARFTLMHNPCDALVVHEDLLEAEGGPGLAWLAWQREFPTIFMGQSARMFQRAYELGARHCLSFDMALSHPPLMATVLDQSSKTMAMSTALKRSKDQLSQTRRHIDRLVTLIWRAAPRHDESQWYSEPYILERLEEELARAERYKLPLSLAVGEMNEEEVADASLPDWTPELLVKTKRRCDVVGQYGPRSFLLLMVQTPKTGSITCCKRLQNFLEHESQSLTGPHQQARAFFGVTTTQGDRQSPQSLLRFAEQNLDAARHEKLMRIVAD